AREARSGETQDVLQAGREDQRRDGEGEADPEQLAELQRIVRAVVVSCVIHALVMVVLMMVVLVGVEVVVLVSVVLVPAHHAPRFCCSSNTASSSSTAFSRVSPPSSNMCDTWVRRWFSTSSLLRLRSDF